MGSNTSRSSHSCAISKLFLIVMNIPSWLVVGIVFIVGQIAFWIVSYRIGKERREFFDRLNKIFDTGTEDAKRQFHQRETVAALDDIARAARSIKGILWVIAILLFLLLARTIN